MLGTIIRHELHDHLTSFRFAAISLLTVSLMILSALSFSDSYRQELRHYPKRVEGFVDDGGKVYMSFIASQGGATVREAPSPLGFCSSAGKRELPNEAVMAVHALNGLQRAAEPGDLFDGGAAPDWTFIIMVLLSFGAGLLTYKGISGERRDGTLTIVFANPVPRGTVLAGKYLAALAALSAAFLAAALSGLIVLQASGSVHLGADDWLKLAFFMAAAFLFLSVFVLTGLLCSVHAGSPVLSAVAFLFVWTALVFIVPNLGGVLANRLGTVRTPTEVHELNRSIPDRYTLSSDMTALQSDAVKLRREQAREQLLLDHVSGLVRQVELGEDITRISPASVFSAAAERITGGGTFRLTTFIRNAVRYRENFFQAILAADREDPKSEHRYVPWWTGGTHFSQLPVDPGPAKEFHDTPPTSMEGLQAASWDLLLLVLYNLIAFALAFGRFARQDVAPTPGV